MAPLCLPFRGNNLVRGEPHHPVLNTAIWVIYDLSTPAVPQITTYSHGVSGAYAFDVAMNGNTVYTAYGEEGVQILQYNGTSLTSVGQYLPGQTR